MLLGGCIVLFGGRGCRSVVGVVILLFRISGNSVALSFLETSVFAFVYIFRSVGGVLSVWQHRAVGGSSDGGVKGTPLNNPLLG